MMMKYYTEEEKYLFLNKFVYKGIDCKKEFNEYINTIYDPIKEQNPDITSFDKLPFNTFDYLWSEEKNDNLVTYLLSHPKFIWSNSNLKQINKLKPNWQHINNEGNNVLMIVAEQKEWSFFKDFLNNEDYKKLQDSPNKKGEYFTNLLVNVLFKEKKYEKLSLNIAEIDILNMIENIEFIKIAMIEYPHHFKNETQKNQKNWENLKENINNIFATLLETPEIKKRLNTEKIKNDITEVQKDIDKLFFALKLEHDLIINKIPIKKASHKI